MEIGGFIELDQYKMPMLHNGAVALNCGRNALWYLCRAKKIKKIAIPKFICSSVVDVCRRAGVKIRFYSLSSDFSSINIDLSVDEWFYIVNYYGQMDNDTIGELKKKYKRIIIDNAQAYFQTPVDGVDTIYTCRKFFGVPDGAFLYTNEILDEELHQDESFDRMHFLLGRFERTASEFYSEYVENNKRFAAEPIKTMSRLTDNLLHGIDYEYIKRRRTENFNFLQDELKCINRLRLTVPEGAFMYPLYIEKGAEIRRKLRACKIYIPILWPDVFDVCKENEAEYGMAKNILPLPVDQRYSFEIMKVIIEKIKLYLTSF